MSSQAFTLESRDVPAGSTIDNKQVFNGFGYEGENTSPDLTWRNAPEGTKSFALQVHDPDAPTGGSGWWHWVIINIPANINALATNAGVSDGANLPQGAVQINTDFGVPGWGGSCPPQGCAPHRYNFTLQALSVEQLELPAGATAALAGFMINAHSIGQASFTAFYPKAQS